MTTQWKRLDGIDQMRAEDASYWQECAARAHERACRALEPDKCNPWLARVWQKHAAYYHMLAWQNLERLIS